MYFRRLLVRVWRNGSVIMSAYCSRRGEFSFQYSMSDSSPEPKTPAPGSSNILSWPLQYLHSWHWPKGIPEPCVYRMAFSHSLSTRMLVLMARRSHTCVRIPLVRMKQVLVSAAHLTVTVAFSDQDCTPLWHGTLVSPWQAFQTCDQLAFVFFLKELWK